MRELTYLEAIREALHDEMTRDPRVFLLGEDIADYGGVYKVTDGFADTSTICARPRSSRWEKPGSGACLGGWLGMGDSAEERLRAAGEC